MLHKSVLLLFFLLCGFLLYAEPGEKINLRAALGLTGDAQSFGNAEQIGVRLAVSDFEERNPQYRGRITLQIEDTKTSPLGTGSAIQRLLLSAGPPFIIGPSWADTFQGSIKGLQGRVVLITPSASIAAMKKSATDFPFLLSFYHDARIELDALLNQSAKLGAKKIALVTTDDPFFVYCRDYIREAAVKLGLQIVADDNFDFNITEFSSYMAKLKSKAPEAIVYLQSSENTVDAFFHTMQNLGFNVPVLGVHDFENFVRSPDIRRFIRNVYFSKMVVSDESFPAHYKTFSGRDLIHTGSYAYDAAMIALDLYASGARDYQSFRDALFAQEFDTVSYGKVRFNALGQVSGGKVTIVNYQ